jgi:hypothetical protein
MSVIDDAAHMHFAGTGTGATRVESLETETIASFLQSVRGERCIVPAAKSRMTFQAK